MMPFNKNDLFEMNPFNSVKHLQLEIEATYLSSELKQNAIILVADYRDHLVSDKKWCQMALKMPKIV